MSGALTARVVVVKAVHYGQEIWRVELGDWYDETSTINKVVNIPWASCTPRSRVLTQHWPSLISALVWNLLSDSFEA